MRATSIVVVAMVFAAACTASSKHSGGGGAPGALEFRAVLDSAPCSGTPTPTTPTTQSSTSVELANAKRTTCYSLGPTLLTGENVATAQVDRDSVSGEWVVNIHFANDDFVNDVAKPEVGRQVAIVLDGVVQSTPTINAGITGRDVTISGGFDEATARRIAERIAPAGTTIDAPTSTTSATDALLVTFRERCRTVAPRLGFDANVVSASSITRSRVRAAFARAHRRSPDALARLDDAQPLAMCQFMTPVTPGSGAPPSTMCPNGQVVEVDPLAAPGSLVRYAVDERLHAIKLPPLQYLLPEGVTVPPTPGPCDSP